MDKIDSGYKTFYNYYKKLPKYLAILLSTLIFIWSIVDVSVFQSGYYYGVMMLESAFVAMLIWWLIGAVLVILTWFFSKVCISATVVRTDAILEINEKMTK